MASISRKSGIIGALVIAGVLMVGAYILSGPSLSFFTPVANAESTQALLQSYAQKDSDGDGLPDWEEALYGTDPHNAHSISPEYTDGQEVAMGLIKPKFTSAADTSASSTQEDTSDLPGTAPAAGSLTDQFAQQFFSQYMTQQAANSDGSQPSDSDIATFAQNAMQAFVASQSQQDPYTLSEIKSITGGASALKTYAGDEEAVFEDNTVNSQKNELDYFSDAVEKNDTSALTELADIGNAYTADAPQLMQMSVPTEMQYAHLELANATSRLGADITDMSMLSSDPLRAYIGLSQYQVDINSFGKAFADIHAVYAAEQVTLSAGDPGYSLYAATANTSNATSQ